MDADGAGPAAEAALLVELHQVRRHVGGAFGQLQLDLKQGPFRVQNVEEVGHTLLVAVARQAQRQQRHHVRAVRVDGLRQRRGVDARQGRIDVVPDVPALRSPPQHLCWGRRR